MTSALSTVQRTADVEHKLEDLALRLTDELGITVNRGEPHGSDGLFLSGENGFYFFHYFADERDEGGRQLEAISVRKASDEYKKISVFYMDGIKNGIILNLFFRDAELAKYMAFISKTSSINDVDRRFMASISLDIMLDFEKYRESADGSIRSVSYGVSLREEEFPQVNAELIGKYLGV